MQPRHDTSGPYPFNDLTRQYRGYDRITYPDGITSIAYHRTFEREDRYAFLLFYTDKGYRFGHLWVTGTTQGGAVRRFRNGERADIHATRLLLRSA
jgi:hypothetical protein